MSFVPPRWKTALEKAISEYKNQTVVQLATINSSDAVLIPHVRSLVFREFLVSPANISLPLLISTTDIRTPKVTQLISNSTAELAWWIEGTQQQFRVIAKVHLVPSPSHRLHAHFQSALGEAGPDTGLALFKNEDWEAKRIQIFKSLSAHMKASWCRPVPGSRLEGGQEEAKRWPERVEEPDEKADMPKEKYDEAKRNWETALGNFAVVVVDPVEVDFVELGVLPNLRTRFFKEKKDAETVWSEEELVP
ncbi:pyridoxamine 5'-phosphate oxidase-domain-containing protein [Crassisporium funariophilum]|nr:pyridoxamine 5'-phosphate oxidase-domain-containing protein [Crassisporium funariophilum]